MACEICGRQVKNPRHKNHINSDLHQKALQSSGGGVGKSQQKINPKSDSLQLGNLEQRITNIENQIRYILGKLDAMTIKSSKITGLRDLGEAKRSILSILATKKVISVDDLQKRLSDIEWNTLESGVQELIDEEKIDGSEGRSERKIQGRIGLLIRR